MTTLKIEDTFTANVHGQAFPIEGIQSWPEASLRKVWEYGLQRIFNDAGAIGKDEPKSHAIAKAQKRLDNLANGVLRASPHRESDPVKAEAQKIALARFKAAVVAKHGAKAFAALEASVVRAKVLEVIERNPDIIATAKKNVEATRALTNIDLGDLDI